MDDVDLHLFGRELQQTVSQGLHGTVHVCLDDDVELLEVADGDTTTDLVQSDVRAGAACLFALQLLTTVGDGFHLALIGHHVEGIARHGSAVQTEQQHRRGGTSLLDGTVVVVEHGLHLTVGGASQHHVTNLQGAVLHQDLGHIATALVQSGLDDRALGQTVGVGLQVKEFSLKQHLLKQGVNVQTDLSGDFLVLVFTAPALDENVHVGQLLTDLVWVGGGLIDLVQSEDDRHASGLGVVDGLDGLRHHAVISSDNDDGDVGDLGTTGTHSGKGFVTRRIQEGDLLTALGGHLVGTDVLGDTTRLTGHHVGVTNVVQELGLTMVDVTHDSDDG